MNAATRFPGGFALAAVLLAAARPAVAADTETVLFRNVNVVTMTAPRVERGRDVLVRDGRIERIARSGRIADPPGTRVIAGTGRFLVPGLAEMHAHVPGPKQRQYAEDVLLLYVAHGVTTIRGMLGDPWHLELRGQIERGEVLGPRLYTAGPSFNGKSAPDVATAVAMVREQKAAGYDFLKLHPGLTREVFAAIAATAREVGIPFEGHVSADVGVARALAAGQRAIDHLDGYIEAIADPKCLEGPVAAGFFGIGLVHCAQDERIPEVAARTKAAGTWIVPTQILLEQWARAPDEQALRARAAVRYMPHEVVSQWLKARESFIGMQALSAERAERFIAVRRALIREMHRQGVPIALGSDAPQVFNVPGDSALEELRVYAEAGLGPYEALRTGTVRPAEFFGAADRFGTVREGLEADLLLLEADPLESAGAVRRLAGVMLRGRWLPRSELDARLQALAARGCADC